MSPSDVTHPIVHRDGATTFLDLGARGVRGGYGAFLAQWSIVVCMVLPLGILGLVATTWHDFVALRLLCGLGGALGVLVALGPVAWILGQAWWRVERVRVSPAGVSVELRLPPFRRRCQLGPPASVAVETAQVLERVVQGVVLFTGEATRLAGRDGEILVAAGLPDAQAQLAFQEQLREALERASVAGSEAAAPVREPAHAYALPARLAGLARGVVRSLRRPAPYLFCDLTVLAAALLLPALVAERVTVARVYPLLAAGFLAGVALRRWDPSYLAGLRHYERRYDVFFEAAYLGSGALVGLGAALFFISSKFVDTRGLHYLLQPVAGFGILLAPPAVAVAIHVSLLRRARALPDGERPPHRAAIEFGSAATLLPLAWAHEHGAFLMLEGTARKLGPLALPLVWGAVCLVYLPVRLHYFIDDPDDPANLRWCVFTTGCLALYGLFGLSLPL